jgi:hypothetical protein
MRGEPPMKKLLTALGLATAAAISLAAPKACLAGFEPIPDPAPVSGLPLRPIPPLSPLILKLGPGRAELTAQVFLFHQYDPLYNADPTYISLWIYVKNYGFKDSGLFQTRVDVFTTFRGFSLPISWLVPTFNLPAGGDLLVGYRIRTGPDLMVSEAYVNADFFRQVPEYFEDNNTDRCQQVVNVSTVGPGANQPSRENLGAGGP